METHKVLRRCNALHRFARRIWQRKRRRWRTASDDWQHCRMTRKPLRGLRRPSLRSRRPCRLPPTASAPCRQSLRVSESSNLMLFPAYDARYVHQCSRGSWRRHANSIARLLFCCSVCLTI